MNKNILVGEVSGGGGARWAYPAHGLYGFLYSWELPSSAALKNTKILIFILLDVS